MRNRTLRLVALLLVGVLVGAGAAYLLRPGDPPGMVWIPGGTFAMGTDDASPNFQDAKPVHDVTVRGFWMDATEVTNDQFAAFVAATGYVTVAEKKPDLAEIMSKRPKNLPPLVEEDMKAGSLVFTPPKEAVPLDREARWWSFVPGACWKHPEGPSSNLDGREQHPVVQVCWDDAMAYCKWAGKRLPTEAEWEYAARGGLSRKPYTWGDEAPNAGGKWRCNVWQGDFPHRNAKEDGYEGTAPVRSFEPNGYGLYDMAGNVWEWCADWYMPDAYGKGPRDNPTGPVKSVDRERGGGAHRVHRGGSFLCSDSFCSRYKPAGRGRNDPLTGMSHLGFRCVKDK